MASDRIESPRASSPSNETTDQSRPTTYSDALTALGGRVTLRLTASHKPAIAEFMAERGVESVTKAFRFLVDLGLTSVALHKDAAWTQYPSLQLVRPDHPAVRCGECATTDSRVIRVVETRGRNGGYAVSHNPRKVDLVCANCGHEDTLAQFTQE